MVTAYLFLNLLLLGLLGLFSDAILNGLGLAHDLGPILHRTALNFDSLALLNVPGFAHLKKSKISQWNCSKYALKLKLHVEKSESKQPWV